ncbi:phage/plasmid primase, P4 family [Candidatus Borrarchaeum sp.]|uniref:phage/plasmid primase, P4 family n=1 Tax=Candidatus Borrarchaeum sp. TaxID=2846742 RepID=UPI00257FC0CE|nr:phage/plasmid primase, P4 family [Candidatus Borrarchaeum sp.]
MNELTPKEEKHIDDICYAALCYLQDGFSIIPLQYQDKKPTISWKEFQTRKASRDELEQWLNNGPINLGIVCGKVSGNLLVLDFDTEEDLHKAIDLDHYREKTKVVKTGRGYHVYLKAQKPMRTIPVKPEVTLKGEGSYIVAPPSIHVSGQKYRDIGIENIAVIQDIDDFIGSLKETFRDAKTQKQRQRRDVEIRPIVLKKGVIPFCITAMLQGAKQGERNERCFDIVNFYRSIGSPKENTLAILQEWNSKNESPLDKFELESVLNSVYDNKYSFGCSRPSNADYCSEECPYQKKAIDKTKLVWNVATAISNNHHFFTFKDSRECYFYEKGIYKQNGEVIIEKDIQEILKEQTTTHIINEIMANIKIMNYGEREVFNTNISLICVENGILNLETKEMIPHSPEHYFLVKIPVLYDENAECPEIEKFIAAIVAAGDKDILQELVGYCLQRDYRYQVSIMFLGEGANGKSTFLNLLKAFLGSQNVSGISLQDLTMQRFLIAQLYGKLANVYPDLPDIAVSNTGLYKALTGGDPVTADIKFSRNPITFVNTAKLIFSANKLPKVSDQSDAFYRRWIIVTFPNQFLGKDADPNIIKDLITPQELSGFLNWALEGLERLNKQKIFSYSKTVDQIREDYIRKSNPIEAFVLDRLIVDHTEELEKDIVFTEYIEYCNENKLPSTSKNVFARELPRYVTSITSTRHKVEGERKAFWKGIRFKTKEDEENQ